VNSDIDGPPVEERERGDEEERGDGGEEGPTAADLLERAIVVASALLIAGMLGYVIWQAAVTPTPADPVATVDAVEPMPDTDRQQVSVRVENRGGTGLTSVRATVRCGGLESSLEFAYLSPGGRRTGTVVCPADTTPEVAVENWVEA
jgi:uncharacterized protein (TIGR02588 family)